VEGGGGGWRVECGVRGWRAEGGEKGRGSNKFCVGLFARPLGSPSPFAGPAGLVCRLCCPGYIRTSAIPLPLGILVKGLSTSFQTYSGILCAARRAEEAGMVAIVVWPVENKQVGGDVG
jgi:hypothetical protein